MSGYYDREATVYDESRGGPARARAAAAAVARLVEPVGVLLDVGGGTGIVTAELALLGFRTAVVLDRSPGMLAVASSRLPGRLLAASADRLPVRDAAVDVVTLVWLLHLLEPEAAQRALAEAARVLRPGGSLVTTVDKDLAHGRGAAGADRAGDVTSVLARHGLRPTGGTSFTAASPWGSATDGDPVFELLAFSR
jgi:ubiquinone/menaquinone biosynthesis C-methylase UbiE